MRFIDIFKPFSKYVFEIGASSKDIKGNVSAVMHGEFVPVLKTVVADCGTTVLKNGSSVQTSITAAMTDDSFYNIAKAKDKFMFSFDLFTFSILLLMFKILLF